MIYFSLLVKSSVAYVALHHVVLVSNNSKYTCFVVGLFYIVIGANRFGLSNIRAGFYSIYVYVLRFLTFSSSSHALSCIFQCAKNITSILNVCWQDMLAGS